MGDGVCGLHEDGMMENISFKDLLGGIGRSDYVGTYHSGAYGQSDEKHEQRLKVMDHILSFFPDTSGPIKLLSLPGLSWTFENMLRLERKNTNFLGLEHSRSVYMKSRLAIPFSELDRGHGEDSKVQDRTIPYGRGTFVYSRKRAVRNWDGSCGKRGYRSHRLLLMDCETFATMMHTDYGASMQERKFFFQKFYARNAAWLDFTGPLTKKVETILRHIPIVMWEGDNPLVITVLNGRDRFHGIHERLDRMKEVQPSFHITGHDAYTGKGGVSMLTVYGFIRNP